MSSVGERSLGTRAARGAAVTFGATATRMALQFAAVITLARLLTPTDYGLVAMVTAVIGVAEILKDFGLSAAAVQTRELTREQRDNLFWLNTATGLVCTILVLAASPLIALAYGRQELLEIACALAPVFLLSGMSTQYRASLVRSMRFSAVAVAEIVSPAAALTAGIVAALLGAGYWAIVTQQVVAAVASLVLFGVLGRWLPSRYDRSTPMRDLINFGANLTGSQFVNYIAKNVDTATIGAVAGATPLGYYNRAYQLVMTSLAQVRTPTTTVALPVLSRVRGSLPATDRIVQRGQLTLGLTIVVGLGFVAGAADPLVHLLLGDAWAPSVPYMRLLAAAGAFQTLAYVGYWLYLSQAMTKELLRYSVVTAALKILLVIGGGVLLGPIGVAIGTAVSAAVEWPLSFYWLNRKANVSIVPLVRGALRLILLSAAVCAAGWVVTHWLAAAPSLLRLLAAAGSALVVLAAAAVLPVVRHDYRDVLVVLRRAFSARS